MERVDFGLEVGIESAINTRDAEFQKARFRIQGELEIDLAGGLSFTAIGRFWADLFDRIEPGDPSQPEVSAMTRRRAIGRHVDFDLREVYVEGQIGSILVTAGKQQVVWGTADGLKVLDLVNPQEFGEFILPAFEESRTPLWTLNLEIPLGDVNAQLIWIPDPSFHDIPAPDALYAFTSPLIIPTTPSGAIVDLEKLDRPRNHFSDSDAGLRLSTFWRGWDLTLNYLYHYDDSPILFRALSVGPDGLLITVRPGYRRTHTAGGTVSNAFGSLTARGEIGYSTSRFFSTTDPVDRDGVFRTGQLSYVLGLDWYEFENTFLSLQLFQVWRPDTVARSTVNELDTFITIAGRRHFLNEQLLIELTTILDVREGDGLLRPKISYELSDRWMLWGGFDVFFGTRKGLFGQFTQLDRLVLGVRWSI